VLAVEVVALETLQLLEMAGLVEAVTAEETTHLQ
jgi:hypothetical protein